MATIIDNIELDESNIEFNYASDFIRHTVRLVYLTGKAGTGKTTFLKYLRETTEKNTIE
jgi:ABC-type ATPase involved in cell division